MNVSERPPFFPQDGGWQYYIANNLLRDVNNNYVKFNRKRPDRSLEKSKQGKSDSKTIIKDK